MAGKKELVNLTQELVKLGNGIEEGLDLTKKETEMIVSKVFEGIHQLIKKDGNLKLHGFGTFEKRSRAARKGVNPQTKEEIDIPASNTVGLKPSKALKDSVNE